MYVLHTVSFQRSLLAVLVFAWVGSACGGDKELSATMAAEGIQRATWATAMVQQGRKIADPWFLLPTSFNDTSGDVQEVAEEAFGHCVEIDENVDIETQKYTWDIEIKEDCGENTSACTGHLTLDRTDETIETVHGEPAKIPWIRLRNFDLMCGDTPVDQGELRFRDTRQPNHTLGGAPDAEDIGEVEGHELTLRDFQFARADAETLAAEDFQGTVFLYDTDVPTNDEERLDVTIVNGTASFDDSDASRTWGVDFIYTAVHAWNSTPRGGTLNLRTIDDSSFNFETTWLPLTRWSTQPTIQSGKEVWVGCISHDESQATCD